MLIGCVTIPPIAIDDVCRRVISGRGTGLGWSLWLVGSFVILEHMLSAYEFMSAKSLFDMTLMFLRDPFDVRYCLGSPVVVN